MKKSLAFLITILMVASSIPMRVNALENGHYSDRDYSYSVWNNEVTITSIYISGDVVIPENIAGGTVTGIMNIAFSQPHGSPTSITIPASVRNIEKGAFSNCSSLLEINVDPNNPNYSSVDGALFDKEKTKMYFCAEGKSGGYTIPDGVKWIEEEAFSGCSSLTSVTIPDSVIRIGQNAFSNCSSLTSVMIPDSVKWIEEGAFSGCSLLTSVTMPKSAKSLGRQAFFNCSSLLSLTIPVGVTLIEYDTFSGCTSLTSVTIPDSVTQIGQSAFSGCSSLTSITIPNSVIQIEDTAFEGCDKITDVYYNGTEKQWGAIATDNMFDSDCHVYFLDDRDDGDITCFLDEYGVMTVSGNGIIPDGFQWKGISSKDRVIKLVIEEGVTGIGDKAFSMFEFMTSVTIPDSVKSIGNGAFSECSSLMSVTIPDSVTSIGNSAFYSCSSLVSIAIPNGVTRIADGAFLYCTSLTSVTIPSSVISIENCAFSGCSSLTSITIPDSVVNIESGAFSFCVSLSEINVDPGNPFYSSEDGVLFDKEKTELYFCGKEKSGEYIIPNSVTAIEYAAFSGCNLLTSVTIPDGVTIIDYSTFSGCKSLTSVTIPDSLKTIGLCAFSGCSSLASITIPASVWSIAIGYLGEGPGFASFYGCSSLSEINVDPNNPNYSSEDGVLFNKEKTELYFCGKGKSGEYIIPNSVTSIGGNAFSGCKSLTSVIIPDSVTYIGQNSFSGCDSLTSITIPSSVVSIALSAFSNCSSLSEINVDPNNPNYSSENGVLFDKDKTTVYCCAKGKSGEYIIPNSVTSIGGNAFSGCKSLSSVIIPDSVTYIGQNSFSGCDSLTSITIPSSVVSIASSAFFNCSSLSEINVDPNNPNYSSENGVLFNRDKTTVYCCANGKSGEYIIPYSVKRIEHGAFSGCSSLTSITIPNSVISIGNSAFSGCSSLVSIILPKYSVINRNAFSGCTSLSDIYYRWTEKRWEAMSIYTEGNQCLKSANIYCNYNGERPVIKGDIDGDGRLTMKDACSLKGIILGVWILEPTSDKFIAADINGDGRIDTRDAFLLKRKLSLSVDVS